MSRHDTQALCGLQISEEFRNYAYVSVCVCVCVCVGVCVK
jgi:hypothetical protein